MKAGWGDVSHHGSLKGWGWPGAATLLLLVALGVAVVYWDTLVSLTATWAGSTTFTHGFLIPPISAFLIWRQHGELAKLTPRVTWLGLLGFAALVLFWLVGDAADVQVLRQFAVVGMLPVIVWTFLGPSVLRVLAFPLGFLVVFAVPWGEAFVPYLQDFTAWFSVQMLGLTGVSVFWEGRLISTATGDFEVAEACSGIRYVIASLALGTLFGYMAFRATWKRIVFIGVALLVPIIANGLRAYGIILLAHFSNMRLATGVDHLIYGWVFFGFVMFLLFWLGARWSDTGRPVFPSGPMAESTETVPPGSLLVRAVGVLGLAVTGPAAAYWTDTVQRQVSTEVVLPAGAPGWRGPIAPEADWDPKFIGADVTRHRLYAAEGASGKVHLLVVHYRRERQGAELIHSRNHLDGLEWRHVASTIRSRNGSRGGISAVREWRLANGPDRRLIWTWYDIGGRLTPHAPAAKAYAALNRLMVQPGDATQVAVATPISGDLGQARNRLADFLHAHPRVSQSRGLVRVREAP